MPVINASDVRRDWGGFIDSVIREKPRLVKRSRDYFVAISVSHILNLLDEYHFKMDATKDTDGSVTATLEGFDLVVNAPDTTGAKNELAKELLEYAEDYFDNFDLYYRSPNRHAHYPYVLKVLLLDDMQQIIALIN